MNKKLSIFAIILIIIGLVGTIWSGINTMPYFMSEISKAEQEAMKEETIYNKDIVDIKKVTIYTINSNVRIKRNNENKITVNRIGNQDFVRYDVNNNKNTLTIKEIENDKRNYIKQLDFKKLFNNVIESLVSIQNEGIIVYLPDNIDLEVVTASGDLRVESDIVTKEIIFKTSVGRISLPKEVKNIENLQILSSNSIYLDVIELLGVKDVDIECNYLTIYSNENYMFVDNIENYIPLNLNISQYDSDGYNSNVNIKSNIPVAKNLNIKGNDNSVYLQIPIEKYKMNFDISVSENIYLNNNMFTENAIVGEVKKIKGILNKDLEGLDQQYNVNIKSDNLEIN